MLFSLSGFLFVLFATFAQDWKFILPIVILASLLPFLFLEIGLAIVFAVGILASLILTFVSLDTSLKSYLTFNPNSLFGPLIRHLSSLLILSLCVVYFLSTNKLIAQNGFQIPDSLIDSALKFTPQLQSQQSETTSQLSIPPDQIELLKKNPELLRQYGLDPKILDSLDNPGATLKESSKHVTKSANNLIKQTIKDQFQSFIQPYQGIIPAVLAVLLLLTLQSLTSLINLFIYPLLWVVFYIFEKTGFIHFEVETREVKKMVI